MKNENCLDHRDKLVDAVIFAVLLLAVCAVTLTLFYRQTLADPEVSYESDMHAYILEMQGLDSGYSFPYPVFFKTAAFFNLFTSPELAVALATMLLNSLGIVFVKLALDRIVLRLCENGGGPAGKNWLMGPVLSVLAVSLFFISMLYPPPGMYLPGIRFKYVGVFTANPFHNATYMAARPFAVLAFLWFVKLLPVYERGVRVRNSGKPDDGGPVLSDYVLFSGFLLAATMTKPSFTIVLVGAAGLVMLYRLFRSRFQNIVSTIQLGLCFVPTFIDLLYQYRGVFIGTEEAEGGIGFTFGEIWGYYCDNIPLAICLAIGFPLLVLVLNFRELKKDTMYRFSWQIYLVSLCMAFFLYEKGFRKPDFNFSWGYMYGIFFCHLSALTVLLKATLRVQRAQEIVLGKGKKNALAWLLICTQWLAYLCHVVCGLGYFITVWQGDTYY